MSSTVQPIIYDKAEKSLKIIDQLFLPLQTVYLNIESVDDGFRAIKHMNVRGAPAIAIVGVLSLAVELNKMAFSCATDVKSFVHKSMQVLISARPTAVNIATAAFELDNLIGTLNSESIDEIKRKVIEYAENMIDDDIKGNKRIGGHGAAHIMKNCKKFEGKIRILTHCNTGSLATAGYGTALGVIRSLHTESHLDQVFCTETRAYNQGARLTAYELFQDEIPSTLIIDSAVSIAFLQQNITAVVVGADRIAMNGDTANKIGTYQIAISALHHKVPFYIAAPVTTIDKRAATGGSIVIEERAHSEITHFKEHAVVKEGVRCWNPAFDVTPAELITGGIITEYGVIKPTELRELFSKINACESLPTF